MSVGDGSQDPGTGRAAAMATAGGAPVPQPTSAPAATAPPPPDVIAADEDRADEHFIPVTRYALADRLSRPQSWPPGVAADARRFFSYLDYWRQQRHHTNLMHLLQAYEPFSPDSDLFVTRQFTEQYKEWLDEQNERFDKYGLWCDELRTW